MTEAPTNAIEVRDLKRNFKAIEAVRGITFDVPEGELFGFLGPNGAGKSTTINMLCTLLHPSGGKATVSGFDVETQRSEVRRSIGLVFQQTTLDDYLSAEQNLRFHAYAYAVSPDLREERIKELLTMVELWDRRKGSVRTFSGGMKRRLEIARGLIHRPRVLFLDEPTIGLDPQTRRHIWDYLLRVREQENLTIFLTTQYLDEAENCERIAIIDNGKIVALDSPDGLKRQVGGELITFRTPDVEPLRPKTSRPLRRRAADHGRHGALPRRCRRQVSAGLRAHRAVPAGDGLPATAVARRRVHHAHGA